MKERWRHRARWGLVLFYGLAGILHLALPHPFVSIVPPFVPAPDLVVALTGIAELLGSAGLAQPRSPHARKIAGSGLALYALCVWPANVQHMLIDLARDSGELPLAYHIPRLAAQPLLIWLALWTSRVIEWPWRQGTPLTPLSKD